MNLPTRIASLKCESNQHPQNIHPSINHRFDSDKIHIYYSGIPQDLVHITDIFTFHISKSLIIFFTKFMFFTQKKLCKFHRKNMLPI